MDGSFHIGKASPTAWQCTSVMTSLLINHALYNPPSLFPDQPFGGLLLPHAFCCAPQGCEYGCSQCRGNSCPAAEVILQISLQFQAQGLFSCSLEQTLQCQCAGPTAIKWEYYIILFFSCFARVFVPYCGSFLSLRYPWQVHGIIILSMPAASRKHHKLMLQSPLIFLIKDLLNGDISSGPLTTTAKGGAGPREGKMYPALSSLKVAKNHSK